MMTKEEVCALYGNFSWDFGQRFFIETDKGNFVWSDPDYNGSDQIWPTKLSYKQFSDKYAGHHFRDKGHHNIERYCGSEFLLRTENYEDRSNADVS